MEHNSEIRAAKFLEQLNLAQLQSVLEDHPRAHEMIPLKNKGILSLSPDLFPIRERYNPLMPPGAEDGEPLSCIRATTGDTNSRLRLCFFGAGSVGVRDSLISTLDGRILQRTTQYDGPTTINLLGPAGAQIAIQRVLSIQSAFDECKSEYRCLVSTTSGKLTVIVTPCASITTMIDGDHRSM